MIRSPHRMYPPLICCLLFVISLLFPHPLHSQPQTPLSSAQPGQSGSDALPFLNYLFARYAKADTYHFEYNYEVQMAGDYQRFDEKNVNVAIKGTANQYRYEYRGSMGEALRISNGQTEWVYLPAFQQYTEQPTPSGPLKPIVYRGPGSGAFSRLLSSQRIITIISHLTDLIQTARFLPDENLQLGSENIRCIVVATDGIQPGSEGRIAISMKFWIDRNSQLIRKQTHHSVGELVPSDPSAQYTQDATEIFTVAELNPSSFPVRSFTLAPPKESALVKEFQSREEQERTKFVGHPLPTITVKTWDNREIPLQSLVGKPLLLDFWSTSCQPCRESLPDLEKLYAENKDKGLVLVSLDENQELQTAAAFWSEQKVPWPNYHLDFTAAEKFPAHGIPYFVLVDPSGTVVYSEGGFDHNGLQKALNSALASTAIH